MDILLLLLQVHFTMRLKEKEALLGFFFMPKFWPLSPRLYRKSGQYDQNYRLNRPYEPLSGIYV